MEDALTASLSDLLTDLGECAVIRDLLGDARMVKADGSVDRQANPEIPMFDGFQASLWPSWKTGEPDLYLELKWGARTVAGVVVEAKYGAGKSGTDLPDDPTLLDQLGRYAMGLDHLLPADASRLVVYLTASPIPPVDELAASVSAIGSKTQMDPTRVLSWIAWQSIDARLRSLCGRLQANSIEARRIGRVCALLATAGLRTFSGWRIGEAPILLPSSPVDSHALYSDRSTVSWPRAGSPAALPSPPQMLTTGDSFNGWSL